MNRVDLKIVLLGKEYGGKTSLVERYLNDRFLDMPYQNVSKVKSESSKKRSHIFLIFVESSLQTIGAAFGAKRIEVNNRKITMGIWVSVMKNV